MTFVVGFTRWFGLFFATSKLRTMRYLNIFKLIALLTVAGQAFSQAPSTYRLQWNRNPEGDIAFYRLHIGTSSHQYTTQIPVGNVTNYTVTNLNSGPIFFALSAVNRNNLESDLSNEISASATQISLSVAQGTREINVTIQGAAGQAYSVERADSLPQWVSAGAQTADANGRILLREPISPQGPRRFFRVRK